MDMTLFTQTRDCLIRPPDWRSGFTARIMEARDPAVTLYQTMDAPDAPLYYYIRHQHGLWTRPTDGVLLADGWAGPGDQAYGDGIAEAEEYRRTASSWDRAVTEAWILARLTDDEVAAKVGLRPAGVKWFERLFFHVRDRLDRDGYIRHCAFRNWALAPVPADVVKQIAYYGGPGTLELVLKHWDGDPRPVFDPADLDRDPVAARERLSVLTSVMARLLPMKTSIRELRELIRLIASFDRLYGGEAGDRAPESGETKWTDIFRQRAPDLLDPPVLVGETPPIPVDEAFPEPVDPAQPSGARRRAQHTLATPVG
jgi:hypothetical protein